MTTKCPNCDNRINKVDKIRAYHLKCDNCHYEALDYNKSGCCVNPEIKTVRYYTDDFDAMQDKDNYSVYDSCQHCGKKIGSAKKKRDFNKEDLPIYNYSALTDLNEAEKDLKEITERIRENEIESRRDPFWDDYEEYLKSEHWLKIREIVFERDKFLCQSCLNETATEVHHTIGRYRKNEPLFTLISVCNKCHQIITKIDRNEHKSADKIEYSFSKNKSKEK